MLLSGATQPLGLSAPISICPAPNTLSVNPPISYTAPFHDRPDAEHSAELGAFKSDWQVLRDYSCVQDGYTVYWTLFGFPFFQSNPLRCFGVRLVGREKVL